MKNVCFLSLSTGEICLRSAHQFLGYWNNEEATAASFTDDGWIKTGDLGYFNEAGILHITGRDKDMLKYMGYQISPAELEAIIEHLDGVLACCVVGIADPIYGDLPATAIVKSPDSSLTEEAVEQAISKKVSNQKQLRGGVYFLDELPRTVSGKIRVRALRELLTHLYNQRHKDAM